MTKETDTFSSKNHQLQNVDDEGTIKETDTFSQTLFDDVLRTMEEKAEMLFIPAINEFFYKSYSEEDEIFHLRNEHQKEGSRVVTDNCLQIRGIRYHMECQSYPDGTMVIRMFEYDALIALEHAKKTDEGYRMQFPHSCVIYLRHTKNTPDELRMTVDFPNGEEMEYKVPVIRAQDYTKEEIFEKKLYLLLPYYIMRYESQLQEVEACPEKQQKLIHEYDEICQHLCEVLLEEHPDIYNKLLGLMRKVADYVLRKSENTKKGLGDLMGGKVLELETDKFDDAVRQARILGREMGKKIGEKIGMERGEKLGMERGEKLGMERGMERGEKIGKADERMSLVLAMLSNGMPPEEISAKCNLPLEEVLQIVKSTASNQH